MADEQQPEQVNIEAIMQQIREQILAKKAAAAGNKRSIVRVDGKRFPADYYEHLYQAEVGHDQLQIKKNVSKTSIPLIGGLVQRFRGALHEVILYYVNQLAVQQINVNNHLLQAISLMGEELEALPPAEAPQRLSDAE